MPLKKKYIPFIYINRVCFKKSELYRSSQAEKLGAGYHKSLTRAEGAALLRATRSQVQPLRLLFYSFFCFVSHFFFLSFFSSENGVLLFSLLAGGRD